MELNEDSMSSDAVDCHGLTESKCTNTKADLFQTKTWREDTCLKVEGKCLYVSSSILSLISPTLRKQLEVKMNHSAPLEIELEGKKYDDVLEFLKCIYPNIMKKVTKENVFVVLPLAFEFDLKWLKISCEEVLEESIDNSDDIFENVCLYLTKAFEYKLSDLKKTCLEIAADNFDIISKEEVKSLPVEAKAELQGQVIEVMNKAMEAKEKLLNESYSKWSVLQRTSGLAELTGALSNQESISSAEGIGNFRNPRVGYLEYTFSVHKKKAEANLSTPITVHGICWYIDVRINETTLGVSLRGKLSKPCTCSQAWNCRASAILRLFNFKYNHKAMSRSMLDNSFDPSQNNWGFEEFATMEEVLDKDGGFIKDGKARVEIYMYAEEPTFE